MNVVSATVKTFKPARDAKYAGGEIGLTELAVTPVPLTATVVAPGTKLEPVRVSLMLVPVYPLEGATVARPGSGGPTEPIRVRPGRLYEVGPVSSLWP